MLSKRITSESCFRMVHHIWTRDKRTCPPKKNSRHYLGSALQLVYIAGEDTKLATLFRKSIDRLKEVSCYQSIADIPTELRDIITAVEKQRGTNGDSRGYQYLRSLRNETLLSAVNEALVLLKDKPYCEICCQYHVQGSTADCYHKRGGKEDY